MKKLLFFIVLTSGMLFQVIPASAGPWVQDKGRLQTALTSGVSFFDSYADGGGNGTDLNSNFYQYEISYFYNRGLGNRRDISILAGFAGCDAATPVLGVSTRHNRGLLDTAVRYKGLVREGHTSIALIGGLKLPGTYKNTVINAPGDKSFDIETGASVGQYYEERAMYWSADVILRYRTGNPPNEAELDAEFGRIFNERWLLRILGSWIEPSGNEDLSANFTTSASQIPYSSLSETRRRVGLGLAYQYNPQSSVSLTYIETYSGKNTKLDEGFYISLIKQTR